MPSKFLWRFIVLDRSKKFSPCLDIVTRQVFSHAFFGPRDF